MKKYTVKVFENGRKEWYLDGKRHREDGPAIEYAAGGKEWWLSGELHREDGPACEYSDGSKSWWLHGEEMTEEEHKRRTSGVTMEDALAAGDAVILKEQAARIKELEAQNKELVNALGILKESIRSNSWWTHWSNIAERAIAKAKGEEP